jgi:hypothetical protein
MRKQKKIQLAALLFVLMILSVACVSSDASERDSENMKASSRAERTEETGYQKISPDDSIYDVMNHPAFTGHGRLLFPWDNDSRYEASMTMRDAPSLHLWHTNMDVDVMTDGVNHMIDEVNAGKQVFYDIYTEKDKADDPTKENTGLFFFRGESGAPFAVVSPGGGFVYVGSLHEGFPLAMEINKRGYNAFVLKYRVGQGETISSLDLKAAVEFILEHSEELEISPDNYSLWGGSAGARISSNVSYGEGGMERPNLLHPAAAIMAYAKYPGNPRFYLR